MKRQYFWAIALLLTTGLKAATYFASPQGGGDGSYTNPTTFSAGLKMLKNPGEPGIYR